MLTPFRFLDIRIRLATKDLPIIVSSGELFVPGIVISRWPLLSANELPFSLSFHNLALVAVEKVLDVALDILEFSIELLKGQ